MSAENRAKLKRARRKERSNSGRENWNVHVPPTRLYPRSIVTRRSDYTVRIINTDWYIRNRSERQPFGGIAMIDRWRTAIRYARRVAKIACTMLIRVVLPCFSIALSRCFSSIRGSLTLRVLFLLVKLETFAWRTVDHVLNVYINRLVFFKWYSTYRWDILDSIL